MSSRPTSPSSLFSKHSPSTRQADISRILDPSYSSSSASSSSSSSAYVDRHGDLHDPDYRHFPPVAPPKRHRSPTRYNMSARPRWELVDEDALEIDDVPEEDEDPYPYPSRVLHPKRHSSSFSSYTRPTYYPHSIVTATTTTTHPHHFAPRSCDSDDTVLDEYDEYENDHVAFVGKDTRRRSMGGLLKKPFVKDKSRRASSVTDEMTMTTTSTDTSDLFDISPFHQHRTASPLTLTRTITPLSSPFRSPYPASSYYHSEKRDEDEDEDDRQCRRERGEDEMARQETAAAAASASAADEQWTPTCTQALRREWQAVSLRFRFSVFRTQRRIKNRLSR